jgi:hypothetical protein
MTVDSNANGTELGQQYGSATYGAVAEPLGELPTWAWYALMLAPPNGDQHGWYDKVSEHLWLKAQRLPERQATKYWHEMTDRAVKEAFFIPIARIGGYAYADKRVAGIVPNGLNPLVWYPSGK